MGSSDGRPANLLRRRDRASIAAIDQSFASGDLCAALERAPVIERQHNLSPDAFKEQFRRKHRPVVMTGLMNGWRALSWSFDHLAERCGSARVVIDRYSSRRAQPASFAEFVAQLKAGRHGAAPPVYLQEWLFMNECPSLAEDMPELPIALYDFRRQLYGEEIGGNHQLWIGQAGATTRLHQDSYCIDVMHAQILGNKRWAVLPPEACLHETAAGDFDFAELAMSGLLMQCILEPGDVLYLPAEWWHRIELLSDSVGLGRKCLDEMNLQKHIRLRLAELLALALNHDAVKASHPELYNVVMMRNRVWAERLKIDLNDLRPQ